MVSPETPMLQNMSILPVPFVNIDTPGNAGSGNIK